MDNLSDGLRAELLAVATRLRDGARGGAAGSRPPNWPARAGKHSQFGVNDVGVTYECL